MYKATWNIDEHDLELAVKTLKAGASEEDKVKFLQEAAIMGQFSHTNVIKMYGVVTVGEPVSSRKSGYEWAYNCLTRKMVPITGRAS